MAWAYAPGSGEAAAEVARAEVAAYNTECGAHSGAVRLAVSEADSRAADKAAQAEEEARRLADIRADAEMAIKHRTGMGWTDAEARAAGPLVAALCACGWAVAEARGAGYVDTTPGGGCMRPQKQN